MLASARICRLTSHVIYAMVPSYIFRDVITWSRIMASQLTWFALWAGQNTSQTVINIQNVFDRNSEIMRATLLHHRRKYLVPWNPSDALARIPFCVWPRIVNVAELR